MTREEALNTLMKMRAWRKWGKEQKEEERPEMPEQKEVDEAFDVCIKLLQPSLPSNLDEAAAAAMPKPNGIDSKVDFSFFQMLNMFKAGAEWDRAKMMERPEVDLEKEITRFFNQLAIDESLQDGVSISKFDLVRIARHFFELGLNARKED